MARCRGLLEFLNVLCRAQDVEAVRCAVGADLLEAVAAAVNPSALSGPDPTSADAAKTVALPADVIATGPALDQCSASGNADPLSAPQQQRRQQDAESWSPPTPLRMRPPLQQHSSPLQNIPSSPPQSVPPYRQRKSVRRLPLTAWESASRPSALTQQEGNLQHSPLPRDIPDQGSTAARRVPGAEALSKSSTPPQLPAQPPPLQPPQQTPVLQAAKAAAAAPRAGRPVRGAAQRRLSFSLAANSSDDDDGIGSGTVGPRDTHQQQQRQRHQDERWLQPAAVDTAQLSKSRHVRGRVPAATAVVPSFPVGALSLPPGYSTLSDLSCCCS